MRKYLAKLLLRRQWRHEVTNALRYIMATQTELLKALNDVAGKLGKIGTETKALLLKIDELNQALANAGNTTPEVDEALSNLQAQAGAVDDLVADAVPPDTP